ncbi:MAG: transposase domain-containing protein [Solirubrobacteraceae bacterium]
MAIVAVCVGLASASRPPTDSRLTDRASIGVLIRMSPPGLVDGVVAAAGHVQRRQRLLPARLVVYYM